MPAIMLAWLEWILWRGEHLTCVGVFLYQRKLGNNFIKWHFRCNVKSNGYMTMLTVLWWRHWQVLVRENNSGPNFDPYGMWHAVPSVPLNCGTPFSCWNTENYEMALISVKKHFFCLKSHRSITFYRVSYKANDIFAKLKEFAQKLTWKSKWALYIYENMKSGFKGHEHRALMS